MFGYSFYIIIANQTIILLTKINKEGNMSSIKRQKWVDVVSPNTKEGAEEYAFFIALGRHQEYAWRSTSSMAKETGLSQERIEEIITKYLKKNMVIPHPTNPKHWGYWERIPKSDLPTTAPSISDKDKKDRIDKAVKSDSDGWLFQIDCLPGAQNLDSDGYEYFKQKIYKSF